MNDEKAKQSKVTQTAAGFKALSVTLSHARRQTGALRALRVLAQANQKNGFDCPGCAWPDPEERSFAEFCENGAKAILDEATTNRVCADFFEKHSLDELRLWSEEELNKAGRLCEPMWLPPGGTHYQAISWDDAYSLIRRELCQLDSPEEASFYTSGRTSNEAAFVYQLMVRAFGCNNLPDCSNLCHESSGVALKKTLGIGKGTVRLQDFDQAELILIIGQNPGTNHPRMLSALRSAKKKGATIVSVNPLLEPGLKRFAHPQHPIDMLSGGVEIADHFFRVKINGDQALFRAINKRLLELDESEGGILDLNFIEKNTLGLAELRAAAAENSYEELCDMAGLSFAEVEQLTRLYIKSKATIACWAMGLTQHENAVDTICEVSNLLLLRGNVGKAGAGACPVRGHSNVQGDRTMGVALRLPPEVQSRLERHFEISLPPSEGLDSVASILAMSQGKVRAFFSLGGNFLSASPDTEFTQKALSRCDLTVQISTKLNASHLATGKTALILPCLARSDEDKVFDQAQFVTVENSMGVVSASRGSLSPASKELRSETRIVCEIAEALFEDRPELANLPFKTWAQNYDAVRESIEMAIPGFENFNQRVREPGGFELPNGPREGKFTTETGKAHFVASSARKLQLAPEQLMLMTIRSHDQFNTTVYSKEDRYRGISGSRYVLLMNPEDLEKRGLKSGQLVHISSHFEGEKRHLQGFAALPYDMPRGCAAAYFPEANPLIFVSSFATDSRTPTSKSIAITVEAMNKDSNP